MLCDEDQLRPDIEDDESEYSDFDSCSRKWVWEWESENEEEDTSNN